MNNIDLDSSDNNNDDDDEKDYHLDDVLESRKQKQQVTKPRDGGSLLVEYQTGVPQISCRQNFADCSNVFKAFIGSAMVGLPFATSQTGIASTILGVLLVALLTDHCCVLIIKCKKMIIANIVSERRKQGAGEEALRKELIDLGRDLTFGRVAKVCLGQKGVVLVNVALMVTQFGFTIGYFIFLGNTMRSIVKYFLVVDVSNTNNHHESGVANISAAASHNFTFLVNNITVSKSYYFENFPITPRFLNSSRGFVCLLLVPLPILILIAFVRNLRKLAPVSVIANASLSAAFAATSLFMLTKMSSPHLGNLIWFKIDTFPVLFGQVTAAFEGIGTVIPIESSMAENRQRYPFFLHLSVVGLSFILSSFGVIGYIAFGSNTCQIITGNLTGRISILLQALLFVGVLFTYPLQIFPNIQITELLVLKWKQRRSKNVAYEYFNNNDECDEDEQLMGGVLSEAVIPMQDVQLERWESNIIRAVLVIFTAAVALVFRFQFAYIAALTGSIGSSLLSFIIPALCHIHLTGHQNRWWKLKDLFLIFFGVLGGVSGLVVTLGELVDSFKGDHLAHC